MLEWITPFVGSCESPVWVEHEPERGEPGIASGCRRADSSSLQAFEEQVLAEVVTQPEASGGLQDHHDGTRPRAGRFLDDAIS